ncbi:MAG: hypothetical protein ACOX4V_06590 [Anaerovoracaceae bacterium]|jgi:hypothetical protein|nr:hypothetical protein [Clostridiales bacterium]
MKGQTVQVAEIIRPYFTEEQAKESVEKKKRFSFSKKEIRWISSIPMYLPFWLVNVEMQLRDIRHNSQVTRVYTTMINGLNNKGLTLKGELITDIEKTRGIFLNTETPLKDVKEAGRWEALAGSKRLINPPPHRVLDDMRLVYYPLSLVKLSVNGEEEIQVFDHYRGGIDKYMMRYLRLLEKMEDKKAKLPQQAVNTN